MNRTILIILLCVGFIAYFIWCNYFSFNENIYITSKIDNREYLIRRGRNKSDYFLQHSADTLAEINRRIYLLINELSTKYSNDNDINYFVNHLKQNYNFDKISEAAYDPRYTTYTVNKDEMHICLRTRDINENVYDMNLLMYVILHELAHMCNYDKRGYPIQGHGNEFKSIFKILVTESINLNIYEYQNYREQPVEYCGMQLNSSII
jgi:predicted SprT family Zn-dependent metalloprotease